VDSVDYISRDIVDIALPWIFFTTALTKLLSLSGSGTNLRRPGLEPGRYRPDDALLAFLESL
jgi:hypothetical protein